MDESWSMSASPRKPPRLSLMKRCDQILDKGSRRQLGGSAARVDGVELDRSGVPFRQQPNELSTLYFPTARAERSHDDAKSFDGRRDSAQARPYRQLAHNLERGRRIALAKGPVAAKACGPKNDRMLGQIRRCEGGPGLVEVSSRCGEDPRPCENSLR